MAEDGRVAACLSGSVSPLRSLGVERLGATISRHLLAPLGARGLLVLSHSLGMCSDRAACLSALARLQPLDHTRLVPDLSDAQLLAAVEGAPHWPHVLKAYQRAAVTGDPGDVNCSRGATGYSCTGLGTWGNTYWAPVLGYAGRHRPGVLRQLYTLHHCSAAVAEVEGVTGRPFSRVLHSRLEYTWLAPHPPLSLLGARYAWVPQGQDYQGGVNDRHAVLNRSAAEVYFGRWQLLIGGGVMRVDPQLSNGDLDVEKQAPETLLAATLAHHRVPVRRFPGVAFLGCCAGQGCFIHRCVPIMNWTGFGGPFRGKYTRELAKAVEHAHVVDRVGWASYLGGKEWARRAVGPRVE